MTPDFLKISWKIEIGNRLKNAIYDSNLDA